MGGDTMGQKDADVLRGGWIKPVSKRSKRGTGKKYDRRMDNQLQREKIGRERKEDGEIEINERIQQVENKRKSEIFAVERKRHKDENNRKIQMRKQMER